MKSNQNSHPIQRKGKRIETVNQKQKQKCRQGRANYLKYELSRMNNEYLWNHHHHHPLQVRFKLNRKKTGKNKPESRTVGIPYIWSMWYRLPPTHAPCCHVKLSFFPDECRRPGNCFLRLSLSFPVSSLVTHANHSMLWYLGVLSVTFFYPIHRIHPSMHMIRFVLFSNPSLTLLCLRRGCVSVFVCVGGIFLI